jgi:hypothetical protein
MITSRTRPFPPRRLPIDIACSMAVVAALAGAAFATEDPVEPIVNVKSRPVDAVERRMARVRGVVTVRGNEAIFIQDDTAGLLIQGDLQSCAADPAAIVPGAEVVATGTVGRGGFAPMLHLATIEAVGTKPFPQPTPVERGRFFTGGYDGMLVEVEGVFKGAREQEGLLVLSLESDGREFETRAAASLIGRDLEPVVGASVRVRGLALPVFNTRGGLLHRLQAGVRDPRAVLHGDEAGVRDLHEGDPVHGVQAGVRDPRADLHGVQAGVRDADPRDPLHRVQAGVRDAAADLHRVQAGV